MKKLKYCICYIIVLSFFAVGCTQENNATGFASLKIDAKQVSVVEASVREREIELSKPMEVPAGANPENNFLTETTDIMVGSQEWFDAVRSDTEKTKEISQVNGQLPPHGLFSGELAVYLNEGGKFWELKKGDIINIKFIIDEKYMGGSGSVGLGFCIEDDSSYYQEVEVLDAALSIYEGNTQKELSFKVPKDGQYSFFIGCYTADPIVILSGSINKK